MGGEIWIDSAPGAGSVFSGSGVPPVPALNSPYAPSLPDLGDESQAMLAPAQEKKITKIFIASPRPKKSMATGMTTGGARN